MNPDEVLAEIQKYGIKISRRTLLNYEKQGLITEPKRSSGGRGVGRSTEYHSKVVGEVLIAWKMIHELKYSPQDVNMIKYVEDQLLKNGSGKDVVWIGYQYHDESECEFIESATPYHYQVLDSRVFKMNIEREYDRCRNYDNMRVGFDSNKMIEINKESILNNFGNDTPKLAVLFLILYVFEELKQQEKST